MTMMTVEQIEHFLDEVFPQRMGKIESVGDDMHANMRLAINNTHLRPGSRVSGPTMMGLADVCLYVAILAQIGPVAMAVTTDLNCHFLRAAPGDRDMIAKAKVIKLGRRLAVGEVQLFCVDDDRPVAHITATYALPESELAITR
ncbi:PaaI family thioesterase [Halomonas sediminis]